MTTPPMAYTTATTNACLCHRNVSLSAILTLTKIKLPQACSIQTFVNIIFAVAVYV